MAPAPQNSLPSPARARTGARVDKIAIHRTHMFADKQAGKSLSTGLCRRLAWEPMPMPKRAPPPLGTNLPSTIVWPTGALSKRLSHAHARARTGARMNACSARTVLGKAAQRSGSKQPGKAAYYKKDVGIAALFPFRRRDTRAPMRARACPYVSPWNQRTMT